MVNSGWIKLHRSLLDWEWYSDANTKIVFLHLLLIANIRSNRYKGFEISEGQIVTSLAEMAGATGLSARQIRTALNHLKTTGEVTVKTTNKFSVITIANWSIYQSDGDEAARKMTSGESVKRQSTDTLSIRNKEVKKKNICSSAFDSFWTAYPKKQGKADAIKAWDKLNPDTDLIQKIIEAVGRFKATDNWLKNDGQYIPLPATFLRGKRWEDEIFTTGQQTMNDPYRDINF